MCGFCVLSLVIEFVVKLLLYMVFGFVVFELVCDDLGWLDVFWVRFMVGSLVVLVLVF